ncbi:MAG: hypothetical protein HeimC3_22820 [Candidatus Heimdallarchaeota archaeon LC_3]|nr:MAG: hypothetical protein HeimC3_22820 [Candidatus Heimdallarchaeota archaeon LC_3]
MTSGKFNYSELSENYFSKIELKRLTISVGINKITESALMILGKYISDLGRIITLLALTNKNDTSSYSIDASDIKLAHSNLSKYDPPQIYYVWFISPNGTCLFSKSFNKMEFPDAIFSGMLLGMHVLVKELTGRSFERIDMGDLAMYIYETSSIVCALVSKKDPNAKLINQALVHEFLDIFGKKVFESAVDLNLFRSFDKVSRAIVRDWIFINPELETSRERKILLEVDSIEEQVISGYKKGDLAAVMEELRKMEVFKLDNELSDEKLGELLEKKFKFKDQKETEFRIDIQSLINDYENNE